METIELTRGASFLLTYTLTDEAAQPLDIDGAIITSEIREGSRLVQALDVEVDGSVVTVSTLDTTAWPVGSMRTNLKIVFENNSVAMTSPITVRVDTGATV